MSLKNKEVIDISSGKRLGLICDCEINVSTGIIESIVIPGGAGFMGIFNKHEDMIIPWKNISKIGDDIVLIDFHEFHT